MDGDDDPMPEQGRHERGDRGADHRPHEPCRRGNPYGQSDQHGSDGSADENEYRDDVQPRDWLGERRPATSCGRGHGSHHSEADLTTTMVTYREAAARVHRSPRAIKRWRCNGMPMGWEVRDGQRCRVVEEGILLAWWRGRLRADPVHQARLRRMSADDATFDA